MGRIFAMMHGGRIARVARLVTVFYWIVCWIVLPIGAANIVVGSIHLSTAVEQPHGEKTAQFKQGNTTLCTTPRLHAWTRLLRFAFGIGIAVLLLTGGLLLLLRRLGGLPMP